jgi:hypothetical protein
VSAVTPARWVKGDDHAEGDDSVVDGHGYDMMGRICTRRSAAPFSMMQDGGLLSQSDYRGDHRELHGERVVYPQRYYAIQASQAWI